MNGTEKNIKKYGLIIGIVLFLLLIAGLSYAWYAGQAINNTTVQGEIGMCLEVDYVKGGNVSGVDLLLLDRNEIINNNQITISNGMIVTSLSAGMDNITCPDTYGYLNVYMKDTTINSAFINGNSAGALKYVIASYDSNTYPTVTVSDLMGDNFDIIKEGTVDTASDKLIFTDPMLPRGSMADYLIIFYIDGDMTFNGAGNAGFNTTISAIAYPSIDGSAKSFITNLSTPTGTVTNNSIVYNVNTTNDIIVDTRNNVRYYGADPNNYIYFNCDTYPSTNCETWRIIGVVDGKLKLIRSSQIGTFSYDTTASTITSGNGINQWGESVYSADNSPYNGSDLMKLLNPGYESNQDLDKDGNTITVNNSLYYNSGSGTCYSGQSNATKSCDFTSSGLKNTVTRNKIADAVYYLSGNAAYTFPNLLLNTERGTSVNNNPSDGVVRTLTWTGKVAIPYQSDYGYAADLSLCVNKKISQYNDSMCKKNNWTLNIITGNGGGYGWFIGSNINHTNSNMMITGAGAGNSTTTSGSLRTAPVLYLNDTEVISGGNGTIDNPYTLSA